MLVLPGFFGFSPRLDASARAAQILEQNGVGVTFKFVSCCDRDKAVQQGIMSDCFFQEQCVFTDVTRSRYRNVFCLLKFARPGFVGDGVGGAQPARCSHPQSSGERK